MTPIKMIELVCDRKGKEKKLRKILSNERKNVHTTCGVAESCFRYVMRLKIYNKDVQF